MFNTPVLFIIFNRPDSTRKVFEVIRQKQPKYLFVAADGPRPGNEDDIKKCKTARNVVKVDWDCELQTLYQVENLGCGKGPAMAITWFFNYVEKGIIIEDDAVPSLDFFQFATELLKQYNEKSEIWAISSMHIDGKKYGKGSYYFSMMNRTLCAWATWKRAWLNFDYFMQKTSVVQLRKAMKLYNVTRKEISYWCERLEEIHKDRLNESSWDIQFLLSIWLNNGKGICPNVNLSTNIGFNEDGTHTLNFKSLAANLPTHIIMPLSHPMEIIINRKADLNYHKLYYQPYEYGLQGLKRIPYHINKKIKLLVGHIGPWIKMNPN
jgi:hypothetical protein